MFGKAKEAIKISRDDIIEEVSVHIRKKLETEKRYSPADFLKKLDHDYARTEQTQALGGQDGFEKRMGKMWVALTHEDKNIGYDTSFIKEIEHLSAQIKNIEEPWGNTIGNEVEIDGKKEKLSEYLKTHKRDLIIAALEKLESQQKVNTFIQLFEAIIKYIFGDRTQELRQKRAEDMSAGKSFTPLTGKDLFAQVITSDTPAETFKSVLNAQYNRLAEKGSVREQAIHSLFEGRTSREKLTAQIKKAQTTNETVASERGAAQKEMDFNTKNPNVRGQSNFTRLLNQKREEQKGRKKPGG